MERVNDFETVFSLGLPVTVAAASVVRSPRHAALSRVERPPPDHPHPLGAIVFAEDGASPRTTLPIRMHYTPDTDRLHLRHACATARPLSELVPRTAATGYRLQKLRASGRNPPCRAVCSSRRTERPLGVRLVDGSLGCPRTHNQFHPVRLVPAGDQQRASIR